MNVVSQVCAALHCLQVTSAVRNSKVVVEVCRVGDPTCSDGSSKAVIEVRGLSTGV